MSRFWELPCNTRNYNIVVLFFQYFKQFSLFLFTKARDFTTKESSTSAHILNLQRLLNNMHFSSYNPHRVRKGLVKGESLRLLKTNSSAQSFNDKIYNFKKRLRATGYPHNLIEKITSEGKFTEQKSALQKNNEVWKKILPFVTTCHPHFNEQMALHST